MALRAETFFTPFGWFVLIGSQASLLDSVITFGQSCVPLLNNQ
jgi:hypothetical protein